MLYWSLLVILLGISSLPLPSLTDAVECSQSFVGHTGVLKSYNFPFDYRHNLSCTYRIVLGPPSGPRTVCFKFRRFDLERSTPFCSYDFLRFENTKYCGGGLWQYGVETTSPESSVWHQHFCWPAKKNHFDVRFQSDNNLNGGGFYAEYRVLQGPPPDYTTDVVHTGHAPCASHQWTCFNRKCINMTARCNGEDDCGDGSDESYAHARCSASEKSIISCDFSSDSVASGGQCGFVQQDGQWFRTNKASTSGPQADHTNGTEGYYMYTDSDHSPAYLVSPEINLGSQPGTACLSFWYYVYGRPAAAIFRVYLGRVVSYTSPEWERKSAQTNKWLRGEVVIQRNQPLQVTFGAVLGNSFSGIALDDISVTEGCTGGDLSCNFESTLCGWSSVSHVTDVKGNLTWQRHNRLKSPDGPLEDHSSSDGSGSYLLVKADPSRPTLDSRALLVSQYVSSFGRTTRCLRFWYHMSGSGAESAVLHTRLLLADGRLTGARWSQNARFQNGWRLMALQLVEDQLYQIILEGVLDGATGQIAVDELQLADGACPEVDSGACAGGEFLCGDGSCIPSVHKCDGITHCQDGSDEDWRAACPKTTTTVKPTVCPVNYFQCASDGHCISRDWLCDNFKDCQDGSDESHLANCNGESAPPVMSPTTLSPCGEGRYNCQDGQCIDVTAKCNNVKDCNDGSDEGAAANCTGFVTTPFSFCGSSMFTCATGRECISAELVCDGKAHCADGSDEDASTALCATPINTQGLGTSGAVGIALAFVAIIIIIVLNVVLCRRHKARQRQEPVVQRSNTPDTTTPDISTISYGDDTSLSRPLEDSLRCSTYRPGRREGSGRMINPVNELQQRIDQMDDLSRQSCIENLERYMINPRRVQPLPPVPASRVSPQDIVDPNDYILALRTPPVHPPPYSIRDYQNLQYIPGEEQTEGSDGPSSSGVYSLPPDEPPPPYDGRKEHGEGGDPSRRPSGSQNSLSSLAGLPGYTPSPHSHTLRQNNRPIATLPLNHRNLISQTLPHGSGSNNNNNPESNPVVSSQPVMTYSHSSVRLGVPPGHATTSQPVLNSSFRGGLNTPNGYPARRMSPSVRDPQGSNHNHITPHSPSHHPGSPTREISSPISSQTLSNHISPHHQPPTPTSIHHRSYPSSSSNASLSSLQQQQQPLFPQRRSPSHPSNHSHHDSSISSHSNASHHVPSSTSSRVSSPVQNTHTPIRASPHQVQLQYLPSSSV